MNFLRSAGAEIGAEIGATRVSEPSHLAAADDQAAAAAADVLVATAQHYVVLHAGLFGHSKDTDAFARFLRAASAEGYVANQRRMHVARVPPAQLVCCCTAHAYCSAEGSARIIVLQPDVNDPFFSGAARVLGRVPIDR